MGIRKAKKVIIVTEAGILKNVVEIVNKLGAGGYTILRAAGKGRRGVRGDHGIHEELFGNIIVEVIGGEELVKKIASEIVKRYSKTHACIVYLQDVEVIEIGELYNHLH